MRIKTTKTIKIKVITIKNIKIMHFGKRLSYSSKNNKIKMDKRDGKNQYH